MTGDFSWDKLAVNLFTTATTPTTGRAGNRRIDPIPKL